MNPTPALRIIIGFSPGSASDDIANLIAAPLGTQLGRKVSIERIPGESGTLGAQAAAACAADGNTVFMATLGTHTLASHMRSDLPYDPVEDFEPVCRLTQSPMLLACHLEVPVRTLSEFVAHARAYPAALAYGTSAIGGAPHLAAELFQLVTGVELRHARYDETNKLYADLEAGQIALSFNNIMSMWPRCRLKKLRALGVTSSQRAGIAPDIPTLAESGLNGCEVSNWLGLVAPRGTPAALLEYISTAATAVINSTDVSATLNAAGIAPCATTPAAFGEFISAELNRWRPVVARFTRA
jgi:tripartite-type tricarboxylate transporter receptor subunit TctC